MNNIHWGKIIEMEEISKVIWSKNAFTEGIEILSQKETCLKPYSWLVPKSEFIKNLPVMQEKQEMWAQSQGQEDPLEEEMATHSSILAWRIPWTEEPGGVQYMRSQRVTWLSVWTHKVCIMFNFITTTTTTKLLQSCPTLCDPMDCSLLGFSIYGILQARILEWVAISFSNAWKWKVKVKSLSRVHLLATPWTAASQAPPSMGFSGQQYWSGVPDFGGGSQLRMLPNCFPKWLNQFISSRRVPVAAHPHQHWKWKWSRSVVSDSLRPRGL